MDREFNECEMKHVISRYAYLMTKQELHGLAATSYKNGTRSISGDRATLRKVIFERLMREHGERITIHRCESCEKIFPQSWKKLCPQCRSDGITASSHLDISSANDSLRQRKYINVPS